MPLDLISNLASLYYKDRLEELNEYASNASDIQSEQLFDLLREAELTEWGKQYDFANIFSYQDFREKIPVTDANSLEPYLKRVENGESNILWPGNPKKILKSFNGVNIPVSIQSIEESHMQGLNDLYAIHLRDYPDSKLFAGYFLSVGNDGENAFFDEISTLLRENDTFLFSLLSLPKKAEMCVMSDENIEQFIKEITTEKISCFKGSPEGLAKFIEKARLYRKDIGNLDFMSGAEVLFCKTTTSTEKLEELKRTLILPVPLKSYFCSPEGFIGIQEKADDMSYLLMLDLSAFYEFLPANESESTPIPLDDIEPGIDYQLVITNCSGLWRYKSDGPKLKFISKAPFRFILV